jgi:hypothetical protein
LYPKRYILKIAIDYTSGGKNMVAFFYKIGFDFIKIETEEGNFFIVLSTMKNHEILLQLKKFGCIEGLGNLVGLEIN